MHVHDAVANMVRGADKGGRAGTLHPTAAHPTAISSCCIGINQRINKRDLALVPQRNSCSCVGLENRHKPHHPWTPWTVHQVAHNNCIGLKRHANFAQQLQFICTCYLLDIDTVDCYNLCVQKAQVVAPPWTCGPGPPWMAHAVTHNDCFGLKRHQQITEQLETYWHDALLVLRHAQVTPPPEQFHHLTFRRV